MKLVYIAGPFNGELIERNVRVAEALAVELALACPEAQPVVPHSLGRVLFGIQAETRAYQGTIALLRACDAVLLTPDWERSVGARAEKRDAEIRGMPVFCAVAQVRAWLDEIRGR